MYPIITKLGGRKFLLILLGCGIFTLLFAANRLTEGGYITLILAFAGSYLAVNHFAQKG